MNTLKFFLRCAGKWEADSLSLADIDRLRKAMDRAGVNPIMSRSNPVNEPEPVYRIYVPSTRAGLAIGLEPHEFEVMPQLPRSL